MPPQRRALARRGAYARAHLETSWIAARSSIWEAPRRPENPGVESPQQKGDSPMELLTPSSVGPSAALDQLGDEIAELSAHLDAATAPLLDLIREFDARGGWNTGFRSCAPGPPHPGGPGPAAARGRVRVAPALGTLPRLAWALARGELSYAKVRALTRVATPETEERLGGAGAGGRPPPPPGGARLGGEGEGRGVGRGRPGPEVGALLVQALAAARETLYQQRRASDVSAETSPGGGSAATPTLAPQQADPLALLAATALHHGIDPGAPGERYQVVVHVDAPVLADPDAPGQSVLEDGAHVSAETSRRLGCDASRVVMRHDADGRA